MLEFEFPDTGEGVTEGKFLKWLIEEGDEIEEDDVVAEVETDKAVVDVPAPTSGTIDELKAEKGDTIKVGDVILTIDDGKNGKTEDSETETDTKDEKDTEGETSSENEEIKEKTSSNSSVSSDSKAMPKVRKLAEKKGVDIGKIDREIVKEEDVLEAAGDSSKAVEEDKDLETVDQEKQADKEDKTGKKASKERTGLKNVSARPSVRQLAREKEIDISRVEGTGRGGEVTRNDVLSFNESSSSSETDSNDSPEPKNISDSEGEKIEYSGIRKSIGEKMADSRKNIPHVTHVEKADITDLVELRDREKEKVDAHLTYLPFIVKAVVEGMKHYPELNSEFDEENEEIVLHDNYDFNIAVDTEKGLMVPLLQNVDDKSIVEIAGEIGDIAGEAKHGDLSASDMKNGTFSVTNLGVIGGEEFTPIINKPQAAILGIGRIQKTAEVVKEEVVPRITVKLSLSYDHRIIDGADAARFMNEVVENLEDPEGLLMKL